ncbi:hypothetical protein QL285_013004 [Trifolium repens]|nr:hypothetical protein QL285_013004 [Trifolium repens]
MQISTDLYRVRESRIVESQSHTASTTLRRCQIQHLHVSTSPPHPRITSISVMSQLPPPHSSQIRHSHHHTHIKSIAAQPPPHHRRSATSATTTPVLVPSQPPPPPSQICRRPNTGEEQNTRKTGTTPEMNSDAVLKRGGAEDWPNFVAPPPHTIQEKNKNLRAEHAKTVTTPEKNSGVDLN